MKHRTTWVIILLTGWLLTGCSAPVTTPAGTTSSTLEEKQGDTTLTGTVTATATGFVLKTGQQTIPLDSYTVDLSTYADQGQVTLTGQYSGDTLFIAKVDSE